MSTSEKKRGQISESSEQQDVVRVLRAAGVLFCAVPNGGSRRPSEARRLVAEGVEAGAPDLLIFDPPRPSRGIVGVALEMKRRDGVGSDVSTEQRAFHRALEARGWAVLVGYGRDDALLKLTRYGYTLGVEVRE